MEIVLKNIDKPKDLLIDQKTEDLLQEVFKDLCKDGVIKLYSPSVKKLAERVGCDIHLHQHHLPGHGLGCIEDEVN